MLPNHSGKVLPTELPFCEAVRVGNVLYLSGQMGIEPGKMQLVHGGIEAETRQTLENIRTVLEAHGYSLDDLVRCTVMLADIAEWPAFNEVYRTFFPERFPARSALGGLPYPISARISRTCRSSMRSSNSLTAASRVLCPSRTSQL